MTQEVLKNISNPKIREKYQKYLSLPKTVKKQFFNVKIAKKIYRIGKENKLTDDQISEAAYLTGAIMLNELKIDDFVSKLMKACDLDKNSARQLARQINQAIFLPIKEDLKRLHQISYWPREDEDSNSNQAKLSGNLVDLKKDK